jgi:hypothetical protein
MTEPAEHPLLASEVIARSGTDPAPGEEALWIDCPQCGRHQSLAEASVEPADDPQDITAYRCAAGCAVLVVTGHPNPVPMPGSGRYRLGDLAIAPLVESGLLIDLPSGREIRLASHARLI